MQEQINSMNDSGDFQDAESNYSGRLSHVSSQSVRIPSSRSFSAAMKGCRLMHGINQEYRRTFVQMNFLRLILLKIFLKEFHLNTCTEIGKLFLETQVKTSLTSEDGRKLWHNSNAGVCYKADDYEF